MSTNIWKGAVEGRIVTINYYIMNDDAPAKGYYGWEWERKFHGQYIPPPDYAPYPDRIHQVIKMCRLLNDPRYVAYDPAEFCKELLG